MIRFEALEYRLFDHKEMWIEKKRVRVQKKKLTCIEIQIKLIILVARFDLIENLSSMRAFRFDCDERDTRWM